MIPWELFVADQPIKSLISSGKAVKDAKVLVLGITFKENCSLTLEIQEL